MCETPLFLHTRHRSCYRWDLTIVRPRGPQDIVQRFLEANGLVHVLRAHQLCMEGYQVMFDNRLSTVWSAPNYCYRCGNLAAVLEVSEYQMCPI